MDTASDPKTSRSERDWIVEAKYCDSDTSTRRHPDDLHAIIAPAKVRTPLITARIEESDEAAGVGITSAQHTLLELDCTRDSSNTDSRTSSFHLLTLG
jgi:hypothetical protein